jgi:hypothetical protein
MISKDMDMKEALKFFQKMKILPKDKIVQFDFCMVPSAADICYSRLDDPQDYGGDLVLTKDQQCEMLQFFGVEDFYVFQLNVSAFEQQVLVDLTIAPESRK